jgi:hypothetical protein
MEQWKGAAWHGGEVGAAGEGGAAGGEGGAAGGATYCGATSSTPALEVSQFLSAAHHQLTGDLQQFESLSHTSHVTTPKKVLFWQHSSCSCPLVVKSARAR